MLAIHEPVTLLTDYLLGALSAGLAVQMARRGPRASRGWWASALACSAIAAFCGGTYHGLLPWMPPAISATLWKVTLAAIGGASLSAAVATASQHLPASSQAAVRWIAAIKLAAYLGWMLADPKFVFAIVDYSAAFLFVLGAHLWAWKRRADRSALVVAAGVLVSFLAAGIQAAGVAPHESFNHNDLYHVVQMLGTWLLYKGAVESGRVATQTSRVRPGRKP